MIILGIDPGKTGAVATFGENGKLFRVNDMPMIEVLISGKPRPVQDASALADMIDGLAGETTHAFVEHVQAMPRDGGVGAFSFGQGFGQIIGILAAYRIPYTLVRPAAWKKKMGLTTDKGLSRITATRLFPEHAHLFRFVKHDGRAEAALIGLYGIGVSAS